MPKRVPKCLKAQLHINLHYQFETPLFSEQMVSLPLTPNTFNKSVASARTFSFEDELQVMQSLGYLQGRTIDNAIFVRNGRILNEGGLQYPNEIARHKYINTVGNLALAGARIIGKYDGKTANHELNLKLLRTLMTEPDSWEYTLLRTCESHVPYFSDWY